MNGRGACSARSVAPYATVFLVAMLAALAGVGVRSTPTAHAAVDEPEYLLTALSLAEDRSLDISDELAGQRWRNFADGRPPVQTSVLAQGRQVSPHDPLLPLLLAGPVRLGGWVAAKTMLALIAAVTAVVALALAVGRFAVPVPLAVVGVGLAFASPPLAVYGSQVYPEMPAALAVLVAVAAMTGRLPAPALATLSLAIVALPWLSVKYVPVAAVLAALGLVRLLRHGRRRPAAVLFSVLATAGAAYLLTHRILFGGWTAYATGDHFERSGEFGVVGFAPDYVGRSLRLVGLFADRGFGLVPWQPAWLLLVPAFTALARSALRQAPYGAVVVLPVAVGWIVAVEVALTMHGFWWPGRQVVAVLPLALVGLLWWVGEIATRYVRALALGLGAAGIFAYATLLLDGWAGRLTWVAGFEDVSDPLYVAIRPLLPDYRTSGFWGLHLAWAGVLLFLAVFGWRSASAVPAAPAPPEPTSEPKSERSPEPTSEPRPVPTTGGNR